MWNESSSVPRVLARWPFPLEAFSISLATSCYSGQYTSPHISPTAKWCERYEHDFRKKKKHVRKRKSIFISKRIDWKNNGMLKAALTFSPNEKWIMNVYNKGNIWWNDLIHRYIITLLIINDNFMNIPFIIDVSVIDYICADNCNIINYLNRQFIIRARTGVFNKGDSSWIGFDYLEVDSIGLIKARELGKWLCANLVSSRMGEGHGGGGMSAGSHYGKPCLLISTRKLIWQMWRILKLTVGKSTNRLTMTFVWVHFGGQFVNKISVQRTVTLSIGYEIFEMSLIDTFGCFVGWFDERSEKFHWLKP